MLVFSFYNLRWMLYGERSLLPLHHVPCNFFITFFVKVWSSLSVWTLSELSPSLDNFHVFQSGLCIVKPVRYLVCIEPKSCLGVGHVVTLLFLRCSFVQVRGIWDWPLTVGEVCYLKWRLFCSFLLSLSNVTSSREFSKCRHTHPFVGVSFFSCVNVLVLCFEILFLALYHYPSFLSFFLLRAPSFESFFCKNFFKYFFLF